MQERELQALRGQIEALRIEAATLTERAAQVEELRALVKTLQGRPSGGGSAVGKKAAPKRRGKPKG